MHVLIVLLHSTTPPSGPAVAGWADVNSRHTGGESDQAVSRVSERSVELPPPASALLPPLTSKHLNTTGSTTAVSPAHHQHNRAGRLQKEGVQTASMTLPAHAASRINTPWARCCSATLHYCHGLPPGLLLGPPGSSSCCWALHVLQKLQKLLFLCSQRTAALSLVKQHGTVVLTQRQGMEPKEGSLGPSMPLCLHERQLPVSLGISLAALLA